MAMGIGIETEQDTFLRAPRKVFEITAQSNAKIQSGSRTNCFHEIDASQRPQLTLIDMRYPDHSLDSISKFDTGLVASAWHGLCDDIT